MAAVAGDEDVGPGTIGWVLVLVDDQWVFLAFDDEVVGQFLERDLLRFQILLGPVAVDLGGEDDLV